MRQPLFACAAVAVGLLSPLSLVLPAQAHDALIAHHASANNIPEALVRRMVQIESRGNARAVSKGNYGLMQIRLGTARAMGYQGDAEGLLDANTNLTYAVRYLAGAYRAAGGSHDGAIRNYQRGYYHAAKKQGFSPYQVASSTSRPVTLAADQPQAATVPGQPTAAEVAAMPQAVAPASESRRTRAGRVKEANAGPLSLLPVVHLQDAKPARKRVRAARATPSDTAARVAAQATGEASQ